MRWLGIGINRLRRGGGITPGPTNTVAPVASGTAKVGSTLSVTNGTWTGNGTITYAYQWLRNGSNIGSATANTYTLVSADDLTTVSCRVTATDLDGSRAATSNGLAITEVAPANTVAPAVTGTTAIGDTLTSDTGTWTGNSISYSYQWQRDTVDISGATASTYLLVLADDGASIRCVVTATNSGGAVSANSNAVTAGASAFTPADLFLASEAGFWAPVTMSRCWQDTARTTPVTATGQPVASWELTTASSVVYAVQATGASQPIYEEDTGVGYLDFNGSSHVLQIASVNFTGTNKITVIAGVQKDSDAAQGVIAEHGPSTFATNGTFLALAGGSAAPGALYAAGSRGSAFRIVDSAASFAAPIKNVVTLQTDTAGPLVSLSIDGGTAVTTALALGAVNFATQAFNIGARNNGASLFFNGRLYGLIVRGALTSGTDLTSAEAWMDARVNP